jgi:hypothetical protein
MREASLCASRDARWGDVARGVRIYRGEGTGHQPMGGDHADRGARAVGCVRADGGCARWAGSKIRTRREAVEGGAREGFRLRGFASGTRAKRKSPDR